MNTKRALISTEEDAQEGWMSFTEASTLEDPLALEEMMRANTVEHKLNPKLPPGTKVPWPRCMWVLVTKRTRHVKRRVADEICHDTVITDMDGAFASHDTSTPTSKCARLADVANSSANTTTNSARKCWRQNSADQHSEGTLCLRQVPARREVCECQVHGVLHDARLHGRARPQNCHCQSGKARSLEMLALKRDPLSDDHVLRTASTANELAELVKDARPLASALRNLFKLKMSTQAWRANRVQQQ